MRVFLIWVSVKVFIEMPNRLLPASQAFLILKTPLGYYPVHIICIMTLAADADLS